jgi:hypothetical protein
MRLYAPSESGHENGSAKRERCGCGAICCSCRGGVRARLRQMRCAGSQVTGMANQIVADGFAVTYMY